MATTCRRLPGLVMAPLIAAPAYAATISEGVDYVDGPNLNVGTVAAGTTTISGTIAGDCTGVLAPFFCATGADPEDRFTFVVAVGAMVVDRDVDLQAGVVAPLGFSLELGIDDGGIPAVFSDLAPGIYGLGFANPMTSAVTLDIAGYEADAAGAFSVDWSVTIEAVGANVAAPTPLALLAGFAGLAVLGRSRRRASR